jgi:hypothetical protein
MVRLGAENVSRGTLIRKTFRLGPPGRQNVGSPMFFAFPAFLLN